MELQSLRTFQAVVEEGGILSASRKLNTVQSNVTTRIQHLEQEIGAALFYRKGRGLELAPTGRVLLDYARQILQLENQAGLAVRQVGDQSGELRIGAMETFAALRLPKILSALRRSYSKLDLRVQTSTSSELVEKVLDHQLDCAFVGGPVEHDELEVSMLSEETLVLARAKQGAAESLPLILFREGCAYRARALAWQRESGQQNADIMEFGTLDGILGCVAIGLGCTLMPDWVIADSRYAQELVTEPVSPQLAKIPTVLIRHRSSLPLKALETLLATVRAGDL